MGYLGTSRHRLKKSEVSLSDISVIADQISRGKIQAVRALIHGGTITELNLL